MNEDMIFQNKENRRHYAITKYVFNRNGLIINKKPMYEELLNRIISQLDSVELNIFIAFLHVVQKELFLNSKFELYSRAEYIKEEVRKNRTVE